jgi:hypothetical protein
MCDPMAQPLFADIAVVVDEYGAAGQVREHYAGVAGGDMKAKDSGVVEILPMRHKNDAQGYTSGRIA